MLTTLTHKFNNNIFACGHSKHKGGTWTREDVAAQVAIGDLLIEMLNNFYLCSIWNDFLAPLETLQATLA